MKPVDCGFRCACTFVHATNVFFSSNGSTGKSAVGRFTYSWCWIMGIGPSSWCGSYLEGLLLSAWRHGTHHVLKRKTGPSTADDVPRGLARVSTSHRRVCAASDDSARESVREPSGMFHPSSQRLAMSTSTVASKHPNGSEPQHHPLGEKTPMPVPGWEFFLPCWGRALVRRHFVHFDRIRSALRATCASLSRSWRRQRRCGTMEIERLAISDAGGRLPRKEREENEGILLRTQHVEPSVEEGREVVALVRRKHGNSAQVSGRT